MNPEPATNPLQHLHTLARRRKVDTDKLHAAARELLVYLERYVEPGTRIQVEGAELCFGRLRSNIGYDDLWSFGSSSDECCENVKEEIGYDGYLHGDFHCRVRGPSRALLIEFSLLAPRIVSLLVQRQEEENRRLARAMLSIDEAAATALASQKDEGDE